MKPTCCQFAEDIMRSFFYIFFSFFYKKYITDSYLQDRNNTLACSLNFYPTGTREVSYTNDHTNHTVVTFL